jgi:hypothetical protein
MIEMATSSAVMRSLYMCCSTVIFEVCSFSETVNSSCVKIRCHETASGNGNRLRILMGVTVNSKLWRLAVALSLPVITNCILVVVV